MRILQVITLCELGGAQSVVVNLANKLSENNEVIVVAGEGDGKMFDLLNPNIKTDRIPSLVRRLSPLDEIRTIFSMRRLYNKYKPDIIHLHSSKAGLLGRVSFPKNKTIYTVHGFDSIRMAYRKFLPLEKLLQKRCAAIVGVSKYDEENLKKEGITKNVSTVYNGIYKPQHIGINPFDRFNDYQYKILCIARLAPPKNHEIFIEVANKLPQCAFIWIGNQCEPDFVVPDNVFFIGNISGAGSYTEYADLFMLPSNYEGLPMVIIESLAMGTPVIASSVGGITELLNGKNGWALENDPEKMANAIKNYLSLSDKEKTAIKNNALDTYKNHFTVDNMVSGYLNIYEKIGK